MMESSVQAAIALGGNQGDVLATFGAALWDLADADTQVVCVSPAYRNPALTLDGSVAPDYWNAAAVVETYLAPDVLLQRLLAIEVAHGRVRRDKWASRTLDLDLLLYGEHMTRQAGLVLPHPGLTERAFVLAPLADIAADWPVPPEGKTVAAYLEALSPKATELMLERRDDWNSDA